MFPPNPDGPFGRSASAIYDRLAQFGLRDTESHSQEISLLALNIPHDGDMARIKRLLQQGVHEGWWQFQEACVTDAWRDA